MVDRSLSDILNSSQNNHQNISHWIEKNIEKQEALYEVLSAIHDNPKYLHIALEYAEESIRRWNYIHPKIIESIEFIFRNFKEITEENSYIVDFLSTHSSYLLHNKAILDKIALINPNKLHSSLQLRLITNFQDNFYHNPLLSSYTDWYRKMLQNLSEKNPEIIRSVFVSHPEYLFEKFGFSLQEGYKIFFDVTHTHGVFANVSTGEVAHLKKLGSKAVFDVLQKMSFEEFVYFVSRFADKKHSNGMNFLAFDCISELSEQKRFYLSLLYGTKLFEKSETQSFLQFVLKQLDSQKGEIFQKNLFGNPGKILDFLTQEEISIFENVDVLNQFFKILGNNESLIFAFKAYSQKLGKSKIFLTRTNVVGILQQARIDNQKVLEIFYNMIAWDLLKFHGIEDFCYIEDRFGITLQITYLSEFREYIFHIPVSIFSRLSYKNLMLVFRIILDRFGMSTYNVVDFLTKMSTGNAKMKYASIIIAKRLGLDIASLPFKKFRENCFLQNLLLMRMFHWVRMQVE